MKYAPGIAVKSIEFRTGEGDSKKEKGGGEEGRKKERRVGIKEDGKKVMSEGRKERRKDGRKRKKEGRKERSKEEKKEGAGRTD